jgi:hypothetical protein
MVAQPANGQRQPLSWLPSHTRHPGACASAVGLARPANETGEWLDPGGGEEAHRLSGGDCGERATRCGGGERRETELGNVVASTFF